MNWIKRLAAVALIASSLILTGCGQEKIGSVDKAKVMSESPRAKAAFEEAKADVDKIIAEFDQKYPNKEELSQEDAMKANTELQRELQKIQQKYLVKLESKFDVIVHEISQEKDISVVINNPSEDKLIFQGAIDITDDVMKKMQ